MEVTQGVQITDAVTVYTGQHFLIYVNVQTPETPWIIAIPELSTEFPEGYRELNLATFEIRGCGVEGHDFTPRAGKNGRWRIRIESASLLVTGTHGVFTSWNADIVTKS